MKDAVLVIGGGIAGIQASLDLAESGIRVYLVEKTPTIGGRMAQLDKTFPTNDCSICILSPKMVDCFDHPNIEVFTLCEVISLDGRAGNFTVRIRKRPRYVDEEKCTGCGDCVAKCPAKGIPDEFDMHLRTRKAAHIYFSQGVPRIAAIDPEHCLYLTKERCGACAKVCQAKAIDFNQKEKMIELEVGAIIVATGFEPYDASLIEEYGYGRYKNVIISLEFERSICANGPTNGHLVRPSDGKEAKTIGFIQCVGSRDLRHNRYCSSVCCMHSTKEAMLVREHYKDAKSFIFYMDMRAVGKNFQQYIARAEREYNVTYRKGRVAEISENNDADPVIHYEDVETGNTNSQSVDLAVLATSFRPSKGIVELANVLGVEVDEYKFFKTNPYSPTATTREGIFACGYSQGPVDIPEAVIQASASAQKAAEILAKRRG